MDSAVRKAIEALPRALSAYRGHDPINTSIVVYQGELEIDHAGKTERRDGIVSFHWLPKPILRIKVDVLHPDWNKNAFSVRIPALLFEAQGFWSQSDSNGVFGVLNGLPKLGKAVASDALEFELANFHEIVGEPVRVGPDTSLASAACRFGVSSAPLIITIDQVSEYRAKKQQVRTEGGFAVSHVGVVRKANGNDISLAEADEVLSALTSFFSFVRGNWCPPIFPRGVSAGQTGWEQFGSWRLTHWADVHSWFPVHQPSTGAGAWDGFFARWSNPDLQTPLKLAIHWYVEANTNAGAVEGAIVLTQAALELLAWAVIVEEGQVMTKAQFKPLSAAAKIRHLLSELKIPGQIPLEQGALLNAANQLKTADDVEVLVRLRNGIVHSSRAKRSDIAQVVDRARWEALQYGLWCIEMVVLRLCDYKGVYSDRRRHTYVGEVTTVPWSVTPPPSTP